MNHEVDPDSSMDSGVEAKALVAAFGPPLTRYARSLCGSLPAAQDAVQETFLRYFRAKPTPAAEQRAAWLFRVCRTRVIDARRKEGRMSVSDPSELPPVADQAPLPGDLAETGDSVRTVLHCMESLPDRQREVLRLKFQNGLSYRQIAEVTELSVNHVGVLLHNAIKALRLKLAAESDLLG